VGVNNQKIKPEDGKYHLQALKEIHENIVV